MKSLVRLIAGTGITVLVAILLSGGQVAMAALPGGGETEPPPPPKTYFESGILIRSGETIEPLGPNLMGDSINEFSGGLQFTQMDATLPGNNALVVALGRHRSVGVTQTFGGGLFGDWDLEIPRLHTVATQNEPNWYGAGGTANFNRCSQFYYPPGTRVITGVGSLYYDYRAFWDGYHLYVPGSGDQTLLARSASNTIQPGDGASYPIVTKNHWQLSCLPTLENGTGEGFLARSPDGKTYRFDHIAVRAWPSARVAWLSGSASGSASLYRTEVSIFPTQVTDRFGNWVRYTYGGTDGWRVTSITSSDGRSITFTYGGNGNRIQSATDGTRTWSYAYAASGSLQTVTQPDGSRWQFALDGIPSAPFHLPDPGCDGGENGTIDSTARTGTITHPSGAVGSFTLTGTYHGRSNVPGSQSTCGMTSNPVSRYYVSRSLTSKTLSGPGLPTQTWSYAYSTAVGSFAPCNGCVNTKTVTVTDPLGHTSVNTFGTQYGIDEGLLQHKGEYTGTTLLRQTWHVYRASNFGPYPSEVGSINARSDSMSRIHTPQYHRSTEVQGERFLNQVNDFDVYARPTNVSRWNSLGIGRAEQTSYHDHTGLWVLGQVATKTIAGVEASRKTFDAARAVPTAIYKFGKLDATYTYNTDGSIATLRDGRGNLTTFGNYKRGLPQAIGFADGTGISGVVNNIGTLDSVTNEAGTTWTYGYDAMGRLSRKTPPTGDAVAYHPTTLSFVQVPTAEYGLEANHWRQTVSTGNAVTVNYFDARWRKRLTQTYDATNPGGTRRMQRFDYDPYNRTTFSSYPARSISLVTSVVPGQVTTYDALGRPTGTRADSELGTLTTTTQYLSGFQKRVINERGAAVTIGYQVFDEPDEAAIALIAAPESTETVINRDLLGKPLSVTRRGPYNGGTLSATRTYVYDANHRLCKTIEPEIGATIQAMDGADNVIWRASGLGLTSTSSCDTASVVSTSKVTHNYDGRNRLTLTSFGDGSPSITRTYTADGLPRTVVSNGSTWTYGYNNRRLLTSESLAINGATYAFGRSYDSHGNQSQLTYPDGTLSYSPNALGEPTQISGYASGVTYHPNGAVAGYTLSNGIVHTLTQNVRGLPLVNRDVGILQDLYGYDAVGNVTSIADQQEGITSRTMGYDGLDRLTSANAPNVWGSGTYSYDPLGNLRTSVVGSRSSTHAYGTNNLLTSVTSNGAVTGYVHDARGNVTGRGTQGLYFDLGNRMTLANGVASYGYDGHGRRVTVSGSNGVSRTHIYSQAGQLLYGRSQQGMSAWTTRHVYLGNKLIAETTNGGTEYTHTDALGSPVARTNGSGQVISRTRYEPYGKTAAGTNPGGGVITGVGFTGHVNDADTGLVYMQQRYYDPLAGRFLSTDPVMTDADTGRSFNRFEYGNNNPYAYVDPDGRMAVQGISILFRTIIQIAGDVVRTLSAPAAGVAGAAIVSEASQGDSTAQSAGGGDEAAAPPAQGVGAPAPAPTPASEGSMPSETKAATGPKRPAGVPEGWVEVPSRDGKGTKWVDPSNPKGGNYVRERGDGTLTQVKNGRALDVNGNAASGLSSPEAHFPRDQWQFRD